MGECSTLSPSLPSGSGLGGKRSRESSRDSDDGCPPTRIRKNDILLELPERDTDPGSETEFSYQEDSTDLCCRSSQTSSSEQSDLNAVEFEVRSPEEGPDIFGDSSTASDASVNDIKWFRQPPPKYSGNSSPSGASSGDSEGFDPEIPRRDYWTCLQCSNLNNRPAFRYCEKCYKVRRDMFQPRLNPRKRRKRKNSNFTARMANSTKGTSKLEPSSTGDTIKGGGIKLELCSQENRDSGVACSQSSGLGCSQSTVASCPPASDSSLSPDSGTDTRDFHGIRLSSTRVRVVKLGPLKLGRVNLFGRHTVDDVDSGRPPSIRGVDDVDCGRPPSSRSADDVDCGRPPSSRGVDDVDCGRPPSSRDIDDVDSGWPPATRGIDGIKSGRPPPSPVTLKRSVKTQTELCFISQSGIPKDKPQLDVEKCMICYSRTLNGIFVHSTMAHMCCCYKCTVKVWKTTKRCPLCNCKVMNVLRLFKGC